jgi:signal peptidase I
MGYNSGEPRPGAPGEGSWVGDLMLELTAEVRPGPGELTLELAKGPDRFQARFHTDRGDCDLVRLNGQNEEQPLGSAPTKLRAGGPYRLRFANFDERLTVWVDDELPFRDGVEYDPPADPRFGQDERRPTENDRLRPAGVALRGGPSARVTHLQLWRDTYYTRQGVNEFVRGPESPVSTYFVQPGNYFVLGDNSSASSDSRYWGLVPERLLLGRALLVYWPPARQGLIK